MKGENENSKKDNDHDKKDNEKLEQFTWDKSDLDEADGMLTMMRNQRVII